MESEAMKALLRARHLPKPVADAMAEALEESSKFPGITDFEVAVIRGVVHDESRRREMYAAMLAGVSLGELGKESRPSAPQPPTARAGSKRGTRSVGGNAKRLKRHHEPEGTLLRPNYKNHVLAGDSNLRNFAESLGYRLCKEGGTSSIGMCWGGATIREVTSEIKKTDERKFIVMAGINDVSRLNRVPTILRDFQDMVQELSKGVVHAVVISPPPMCDNLRGVTNEVTDGMAKIAEKANNISFLDLRIPMLRRDGTRKEHLFERDIIHLSPNGLQVLQSYLDKLL